MKIKSIEYIVRDWLSGYCIIESMMTTDGIEYQRGIVYGLTQTEAHETADSAQAQFEAFGYRLANHNPKK